MVKDAEAHAEEDRRKREEIELRNGAESAAFAAEKLLADNADKVPEDLKTEVEGKVAAVRTALEGEDVEAVKSASEELQQALQRVGEHVYKQDAPGAGGEGPQAPEDGSGPGSDDTVEGEYREV